MVNIADLIEALDASSNQSSESKQHNPTQGAKSGDQRASLAHSDKRNPSTDAASGSGAETPKGALRPRPNAGWLFYKDYYLFKNKAGKRQFYKHFFREIDQEIAKLDPSDPRMSKEVKRLKNKKIQFFKDKNKGLLACSPEQDGTLFFKIDGAQQEALTTGDKGLLTGTGFTHGAGEEGDLMLGLQFDYASGLPYLPGSSVKGLLRSLFPGHRRTDARLGEAYRQQRIRALTRALSEILRLNAEETANALKERAARYLRTEKATLELYFEWLERQIFDGQVPDFDEKGQVKRDKNKLVSPKTLPMHERDCFFDAYIASAPDGQMLAEDVITPHKHPLKEPVPITFIRIAAGVTFHFQFDLQSKDQTLLPTKDKLKLFTMILKNVGAGAKRRHGFGELL